MTTFFEGLKQFKELIAFTILVIGVTLGAVSHFVSKTDLDKRLNTVANIENLTKITKCLQENTETLKRSIIDIEQINDNILDETEAEQRIKTKLIGELGVKTFQLETISIKGSIDLDELQATGIISSSSSSISIGQSRMEEVIRLEKILSKKDRLKNHKRDIKNNMNNNECLDLIK